MFYLHISSFRPPVTMIALLTGRNAIEWPNLGQGGFPCYFKVTNSPVITLLSTVAGLKYRSLLSFNLLFPTLPPK
jgi:hypothetical protein